MGGVPAELISRRAERTAGGVWAVDLAGRQAVLSVKNCVLVEPQGKEFIVVRKIGKDAIAIEAYETVPAACAFGFGLVQCLSHPRT
jgi:hypothetical protein